MAAIHINSKQLKDMIDNKETFLIDFWAPWCPHCQKINPAYDLLADEQQEKLPVVKLDMDENDSLWEELHVELIPTIRLYENGESVRQIVAPKTKEALDEFLSA